MDLKEFTTQAKKTRSFFSVDSTSVEDNLHMIIGLVTEIGELADVFKKHVAYGKEIDWVNVKEEVGDLMWYLVNFCDVNELDLGEILQLCSDKLKARYKQEVFTETEAVNRDLEKERSVLESDSNLTPN